MRDQQLDEIVHGLSCLDHQHNLTWTFQRTDQILNGSCPVNILTLGPAVDKPFNLIDGTVVSRYMKPFAFHIENEVLPHYSDTNDANVGLFLHYIYIKVIPVVAFEFDPKVSVFPKLYVTGQ